MASKEQRPFYCQEKWCSLKAGNTESPWSTPPPAEGVSSRVLFELEESGQFPGAAAFSALLSFSCALTGVNSVGRPYFRCWQQVSATGCWLHPVNTPASLAPRVMPAWGWSREAYKGMHWLAKPEIVPPTSNAKIISDKKGSLLMCTLLSDMCLSRQ